MRRAVADAATAAGLRGENVRYRSPSHRLGDGRRGGPDPGAQRAAISPSCTPEGVGRGRTDLERKRGHPIVTDTTDAAARAVLTRDGAQALIEALRRRGYRVVGPTLRDQAIVYDDIDGVADLPRGLDRRAGRRHLPAAAARRRRAVRLRRRPAFLEEVPAPAAAAAVARRARDGRRGHGVAERRCRRSRFAFIGVRSCELHAIAIQDRVLMRRRRMSIRTTRRGATAPSSSRVNCGEAGGTCFCVSMSTGPKVDNGLRPGADRAPRRRRAPLPRRGRHRRRAATCWRELPHRPATNAEHAPPPRRVDRAHRRHDGPRDATPTASATCCCATSSIRAGTRSPSAASPAATARWSARPASAPRSRTSTDLAGDEAER